MFHKNRLVQLRLNRGLTQVEAAESLGILNKMLHRWEVGHSAPNLAHIVALADFYDVSTDYLLGRSDIPYPGSGGDFTEKERQLILALRAGDFDSFMDALSKINQDKANP